MSKVKKIIGVSALGLVAVISIPVLAHALGMTRHGPGNNMGHPGMMPMAMMHSKANIDQHLSKLKKSLRLTEKQKPAWDHFEQAVKTVTTSGPMGHFHGQQGPSGDMKSHFAQMEQRMTKMKTVFQTRKALIDTLTEDQKKTLYNFMPGPFGHRG